MRPDRAYRGFIQLGRALFTLLGLRRQVYGAEHLDLTGGAVLAVTHFGYLDFALTEWAVWRRNRRLVRFMVTARAFEHRFAGPVLRAMGHVSVERAAGAPSFEQATALLRAGELIGVFPEGRVHHDDVGPLKTGAVRMAALAGVPLIPVVVWGGQEVLSKGHPFRLRRAFGARVVIMVGEPRRYDRLVAPDAQQATGQLREVLRALTTSARMLASTDRTPPGTGSEAGTAPGSGPTKGNPPFDGEANDAQSR